MANALLSHVNTTNAFKQRLEKDGFATVPACLDELTVELLGKQFGDTRSPERNLLSVPSVRALAISRPVREIMETVLGPECFAVRGIFFNKTRGSNWKVVWHQDLTIAVRERGDVSGFGPWTIKGRNFACATSTGGNERPSRHQAACRRKRNCQRAIARCRRFTSPREAFHRADWKMEEGSFCNLHRTKRGSTGHAPTASSRVVFVCHSEISASDSPRVRSSRTSSRAGLARQGFC
jgi:hypothetical protein